MKIAKLLTVSTRRRRQKHINIYLLLCVIAMSLISGCSNQQQQKEPTVASQQTCLKNVTKAEFMKAAEDVLVRMRFVIEKADPEAGIILTRPLSGAQFFELWRSDNVGGFNTAEANLQTLRRTVELQITEDNSGQLCVSCLTQTERLDLPEQLKVSNSGRAYFLFSRSSDTLQKIELNPEQERDMEWIDLGRDTKLETRILSRIKDCIENREQQVSKPDRAGKKS